MSNANPFLTAEYSLGLLNQQESAQAHALLEADYEAVASALDWEDRFLVLADQLAAIEPPAGLLLQIQTALGHDTTVPLRPSAAQPAPATPAPASRPAVQSKPRAAANKPAQDTRRAPQPKIRRHFWSSLWLWRGATLVFALGLAAALSTQHSRNASAEQSAPALAASGDRAAASPAPAPVAFAPTTRAAILQAPGQTSTPGWILTFDASGDLVLTPKVKIEIPQDAAVYLWAHGDTEAPRLLAELNPDSPATLPAQKVGSMPTGQIFEITMEPRDTAAPQSPKGPILFIGRLVALN